MRAYINIGSNIGQRHAQIERAVGMLETAFGMRAERAPLEESEPWGFESANRFLNLGIAFETALSPMEILDTLQRVERAICPNPHRDADGHYIDRLIDIDFIALDDMRIESERLTLPHPHLQDREFFLRPYLALKNG